MSFLCLFMSVSSLPAVKRVDEIVSTNSLLQACYYRGGKERRKRRSSRSPWPSSHLGWVLIV